MHYVTIWCRAIHAAFFWRAVPIWGPSCSRFQYEVAGVFAGGYVQLAVARKTYERAAFHSIGHLAVCETMERGEDTFAPGGWWYNFEIRWGRWDGTFLRDSGRVRSLPLCSFLGGWDGACFCALLCCSPAGSAGSLPWPSASTVWSKERRSGGAQWSHPKRNWGWKTFVSHEWPFWSKVLQCHGLLWALWIALGSGVAFGWSRSVLFSFLACRVCQGDVSSNVTGGNRGMRVIGSQSDPFVCCVPGHGLLSDEEEVAALKCKFHSFWEVMARTFTFRPCWRSEIRFLQHRLGSLMKLFVLEEMRVANCLPISKCLASANRQLNLGPDWQSRALLHFLKAMMQPSFLHCFGWDAGSWSLYVVMAASGADAPIYESFPPVAFMETLHWCGGLGQGSFHSCGGWMLYVGPPSAEFQRFPADLWGSHHINLLQAMTEESVCWRAAMPGEISATGTEPDRSSAPSPNRQAHSTAENRRNGGLNGRTNLSAEVDELLRALPWQQFFFGEGGICNSARNLHSGPLRQRPLHADGIWCFKMFGASLTRLSASRCPLRAFPLSQTSRCWKAEGLDVAGCSMTGSLRVGEALHPGPRTRRTPVRLGALSDVQLLTPQTLALEARQLDAFKRWCLNFMPGVDIEALFATVPQFLPWALRSFSEAMFKNGGALSNYRHLVLAAQRWVPSSRVYMMPAWEMVEKWEMLTPVNHRTPIPETLVTAMCALAWHLKWYGWVGATVLAFYGAGRLGEILRCSREDLVLPSDVLEPIGAPVFLRLRSFKSQTRQPAKVQHMKVVDATASRILTVIFRKLPLEAPLFGASPYQYRKRWDLLLEKLGIGKDFQLTPGGLRGGAAVYHYKNGKAIADLLWLLRLRSQSTLESYLQEVAALNLLAKLSPKVRSCIQTFAATFAFLTAGDCPLAG